MLRKELLKRLQKRGHPRIPAIRTSVNLKKLFFYGSFSSPTEFVGANWIDEIFSPSSPHYIGYVRGGEQNFKGLKSTERKIDVAFIQESQLAEYDRILVCGPPIFIQEVGKALDEAGIVESKIIYV